jgi:hypothetical protein
MIRAECGCELPALPGYCAVHGQWQDKPWAEPPPKPTPDPRRARPATAVLATGDGQSVEIPVGREILLGRDSPEAAVRSLFDPRDTVSRRHAHVLVAAGRLRLRDAGSTNGTWVGGERISGAVELPLPAEFSLGRGLALRISAGAAGEPAPPRPERPPEPTPAAPAATGMARAACGCELPSLPGFCAVHGLWQSEPWAAAAGGEDAPP